MKIEKVYIGGWFQRTTLQLSEVYDFLREGTSQLDLKKEELNKLHFNLGIKSIDYAIDGFEVVTVSTNDGISFKMFEDGLIVLNSDNSNISEDTLEENMKILAEYYEKKLSPALSYLFSLGAPIPKELANIKTVYPYFVVFKNESKEKINELLNKLENEKHFDFIGESFDIFRGDKYYFVNNKTKSIQSIDRYVQEQIFIREFKGQLHRYLNLHRIIWERIAEVKEKTRIKGKDVVEFSGKIERYAKTVNLVDARINQMNTYLKTREKIAKNDNDIKDVLGIIEYRYETLGNTLAYIQQIWTMTKNYVNSASGLFSGLQQKITQSTITSLTVITSVGVAGNLINNFFTKTEMPSLNIVGGFYFIILVIVGIGANKIMNLISASKKYDIADSGYDKDIK